MAAFTRELDDSLWVTGYKVPATTLKNIDIKTIQSWNGDGGGSYAPSAPIIIAGLAGLALCAWTTLTGSSKIATAAGSHVAHGDGDYILLGGSNPNNQRVLVQPIVDTLRPSTSPFAMVATTTNGAAQSRANGCRILTTIRTHHLATLTQVAFAFVVSSSHGPPTYLPQFRVFRKSLVDGTIVPCRAIDSVTDANGWVMFSPRPASAALWFAAGAIQSFTYALNQNNVADRTQYKFYAEIAEEFGNGNAFTETTARTGNVWLSTSTTNTLIADLRPQ